MRQWAVGLMVLLAAGTVSADPVPARQQQLLHLLRDDCGACHGMTLKGGLGLPLTPEALRDKDDAGLLHTILDGRPGTPMPPWRPFLSEDEARWLVSQLKRGLPAPGK
ncbi:cytochrome c55X [Fluviicoccus keumensis]|uniref:Cytochrome c55X n=1 Tax=Fluviicoccus keumensis TaxID=1435465 RepID=A0A4Q7YP98_9GAMM|nr:cytochrome c [Fluviicoccus keumensis]RZU38539.1 cytochrome c55X [Fluviicoccus keumensis]